MVIAPVLWSTGGVVTRQLERAGAFEQVFWRSLFAFLFILVFLMRRRGPWQSLKAAGWPGWFSGALWALMFTAFVIALSLTTIANTLIVMSVSPVATALLASAVLREHVPLRTWIACVAVVGGIAWMFSSSLEHSGHVAGMLVAATIPLAAAVNVVTLRAFAAKLDLVPAVMLGGALSAAIALPFAFPFTASPRDLVLLAFLGVFQLGLPCMLMVIASRTLLAPEIALLGLLEVVLGPIWAWLGIGEAPSRATLAGGTVVLAALVMNELGSLRRRAG